MNASPKSPIWKRAAIRGAGAFALLFGAFFLMISFGKTDLALSRALKIALASGLGYAGLWTMFAVATERMFAEIERRAREETK